MDKKFTRAAEKLKEQAADAIRDIMKKNGLTEIDASVSDTLTVYDDINDANLSYVLVEIFMSPNDGELEFYTANTCDDASFSVKELSVDTLCAIADWLAEKTIDENGSILPDGESGTADLTPEQAFDKKWPEKPTAGDDSAREILGLEKEETEQVRISIVCDRCFTADFLRQLANAIEEDSVSETFETAHGCAEITDDE